MGVIIGYPCNICWAKCDFTWKTRSNIWCSIRINEDDDSLAQPLPLLSVWSEAVLGTGEVGVRKLPIYGISQAKLTCTFFHNRSWALSDGASKAHGNNFGKYLQTLANKGIWRGIVPSPWNTLNSELKKMTSPDRFMNLGILECLYSSFTLV